MNRVSRGGLAVNGRTWQDAWLPARLLTGASTDLAFTMGATPDTGWAAAPADAPPSLPGRSPGVPTGRKPIVLVRGTLTQATTPQGASAIHWTSTDAGPNTWIRVDPPARLTAGQGYQVSVTVQGTGDVYLDFWNGNQDLAGQTVALTSAPDTHPPGRHAGFGGHAPAELTRTRRLKPQVTAPRPGQRPRGGGAARNGHLARGRQVW